ncbi:MAG: hypothetical protein JWO02_629 [Solirubrobacterales bacterium]|nr:hypothetical protein [Solirubrobacterales bacterium]
MPVQTIVLEQTTSVPPEVVFARLVDGAQWPTFSPLGSFELERPGESEPEGVGAIRVFRTGTIASREEIVERVQDRRLAYVLLSGLPIRDYRAQVDLVPAGAGTTLHWRSSFTPKFPGTGWIFRIMIRRTLTPLVDGLTAPDAR